MGRAHLCGKFFFPFREAAVGELKLVGTKSLGLVGGKQIKRPKLWTEFGNTAD